MSRSVKVAGAIVMILALIGLYLFVDGVIALIPNDNPSKQVQAQCQSLGGVYDGEQCWYAGKTTSIDDLMERWSLRTSCVMITLKEDNDEN